MAKKKKKKIHLNPDVLNELIDDSGNFALGDEGHSMLDNSVNGIGDLPQTTNKFAKQVGQGNDFFAKYYPHTSRGGGGRYFNESKTIEMNDLDGIMDAPEVQSAAQELKQMIENQFEGEDLEAVKQTIANYLMSNGK